MKAKAINSFSITFGLVSIPVRQYVARSEERVEFNFLHQTCGSRINQQLRCPHHDKVVERSEIVKGLEVEKDRYVQFSEDDFKSLEAERSKEVEIQEFITLGGIDPIYFEDAYVLGPDEGSERAFSLFCTALLQTESAALGQLTFRGKEKLVCIRPYRDGLMMHSLFYASEIRDLKDVPFGAKVVHTDAELKLARAIVNQQYHDFKPERYHDGYHERVVELAKQKAAGKATVVVPTKQKAVVDLMDALKASIQKPRKRA